MVLAATDNLDQDDSVSDAEARAVYARAWFADRGWEVRVEARDMSAEFGRLGIRTSPTADDPYWADLVSMKDPSFVVRSYGSGQTGAAAVISAKARWQVEQGS